MSQYSGTIVILIIFVCAFSARFGRQRRQSGRRVTAREVLLIMAATWALAWLCVGVPALLDWGRHMPWSEVIPAALALSGLAVLPLGLVMAATWLPRLLAGPGKMTKSPDGPAGLD
jgi:hypothetical protein